MKDKIVFLIIGLLVGAVISTGAFYVYTTTSKTCDNNSQTQKESPNEPNMGNGQFMEPPSNDNRSGKGNKEFTENNKQENKTNNNQTNN